MSAKLIAEEGILAGLSFPLAEGTEWVIGRNPEEAQLVVEDPMVSRRHCRCYIENGGIFIQNLSETNPILINGDPIEETYRLRPRDTILIGQQMFRFYPETTAHVLEPNEPSPKEEAEPHHATLFEDQELSEESPLEEIEFNLQETGRYLLKVVGGPNNGAEFYMEPGRAYVIGTDPQVCDIIFQDTSVSRRHAKVSIDENQSGTIEDLGSSNGTLLDGRKIQGKEPLPMNGIIAVGTTLFVVYDREAEMQTIISPLLPSIVKVLQTEHEKEHQEEIPAESREETTEIAPSPGKTPFLRFLLVGGLTALLLVAGFGVVNLFRGVETVETVLAENPEEKIQSVLKDFPNVSYTYNRPNGTLLLVGHVLTGTDRSRLLFSLQSLPFIRQIEDRGLVVDELVWREINQLIARNPKWREVSIHTPSPGKFVLTGYVQDRKTAENLFNYLSVNFPYIDLLQKQVIIESDVVQEINLQLQRSGITDVKTQMSNGEITFTGSVPTDQISGFEKLVADIRKMEGIRGIRSFVTEARAQRGIQNITDEYEVAGRTELSGGRISVVVNGKFISVGSTLDGRRVMQITPNRIMLQDPQGQLYQIDY